MKDFFQAIVFVFFFSGSVIVSAEDVDSSETNRLISLMARVNLDPFEFDSLMEMRKGGPDILDWGLKYLGKEEELDPNVALTILQFAINVDRFYIIPEEQAAVVRERFKNLFSRTQSPSSLEGVVYFNDQDTIQTLQGLRDNSKFSRKVIDNYLEIVKGRMAKLGSEVRQPIFSSEMGGAEEEVIFCAIVSGKTLEEGMRIKNHITKSIGLDEVIAGIALFKSSGDPGLRDMMHSLLSSVARWSPENEQIVRIVADFEKDLAKPIAQTNKPIAQTNKLRPAEIITESQAYDDAERPSNQGDLWFLKWFLIPIILGSTLVMVWFKRSN